jgi:hypothetical protein
VPEVEHRWLRRRRRRRRCDVRRGVDDDGRVAQGRVHDDARVEDSRRGAHAEVVAPRAAPAAVAPQAREVRRAVGDHERAEGRGQPRAAVVHERVLVGLEPVDHAAAHRPRRQVVAARPRHLLGEGVEEACMYEVGKKSEETNRGARNHFLMVRGFSCP